MRARTEDLLKILDGEPVDAELRERLRADPEAVRELERLAHVREALRRLPERRPPPGLFAQIAGTASSRAARTRNARRFVAVAASIVGVAFALALLGERPATPAGDPAVRGLEAHEPGARQTAPDGPLSADTSAGAGRSGSAGGSAGAGASGSAGTSRSSDTTRLGDASRSADISRFDDASRAERSPRGPAESIPAESGGLGKPVLADAPGQRSYASLVEESVRLERMLWRLEQQPRRLMSLGTASTIADLEDRIVVLDEQLTFATARGADELQRQALWRERVDVMNALLHVRYAQSPTATPGEPE